MMLTTGCGSVCQQRHALLRGLQSHTSASCRHLVAPAVHTNRQPFATWQQQQQQQQPGLLPLLQDAMGLLRPMAIAVMTATTALQLQLPIVWQPPAAQAAQPAAAMVAPGSMGNIPADEAAELQGMLSEDVALPSQLLDFLKLFEKGTPSNSKQLEQARLKVGFSRSLEGRVTLVANDGEAFQIKTDSGAAGVLLLRDALGYCYYLPPDPVGSLQQLDLSDDLIVAQLFANHLWEDLLEPLEVEAPSMFKAPGGEGVPVKQLQLTEQEWRLVSSLVDEAELQPEEPLGGEQDDD